MKKKIFFYGNKIPIFDIEKVLVSNKICVGEKKCYKYFIRYLYNSNEVKPLNIMVPKTSGYVKSCDGKTK